MLLTVIVDKVGDADAKQRGFETGIKAADALALDDAFGSVES